jgi:hypothetical protein
MHRFYVIVTAFCFYAVCVQCRLLFTRRFSLLIPHVRSRRPSSHVQAVVIKKSGAHCNAVLFLLYSCPGLHLAMWISYLIYLGILELHVLALSLILLIVEPCGYSADQTLKKLQCLKGPRR